MWERSNYKFRDRMIEFGIMAVFLLGFALPVITAAFFDILSQVDFAHIFQAAPLSGNIK